MVWTILLVLAIARLVIASFEGEWRNTTRKVANELLEAIDLYNTLPTDVHLGAMVPYLPIPDTALLNELETMTSFEKPWVASESISLNPNEFDSIDPTNTVLGSTTTQAVHLLETLQKLLVTLSETLPTSSPEVLLVEVIALTTTVYQVATYYVSTLNEVTVTSTIQEIPASTMHAEPTIPSSLMDKIEQLINRIAEGTIHKESEESIEKDIKPEDVAEETETTAAVHYIPSPVEFQTIISSKTEIFDLPNPLDLIATERKSQPPESLATESPEIEFMSQPPVKLSGLSAKDVMNQLPSRKVMVEPQFREHLRTVSNSLPEMIYEKPQYHWLNSWKADESSKESPLDNDDYTYEIVILEESSKSTTDYKTLNETSLLSNYTSGYITTRTSSVKSVDNTHITKIGSPPTYILFDKSYQNGKSHHKHHKKKKHANFEDIYNLENLAWTQSPCLSSYFAAIVFIVFVIS